jgi:hypothetical protein
VFPLYAAARWLWAWHVSRGQLSVAVSRFESGFGLGLHGKAITLAALGGAALGFVCSGYAWRRLAGPGRRVAMMVLLLAAALVMWNLWTMM